MKNRILAKEVLVFFASALSVIALWLCALSINLYYRVHAGKLRDKSNVISEEILKLPTSYDWDMYNELRDLSAKAMAYRASYVPKATLEIDWSDIPDFNEDIADSISYSDFEKKIRESAYIKRVSDRLGRSVRMQDVNGGFGFDRTVFDRLQELNSRQQAILSEMYDCQANKGFSKREINEYVLLCSLVVFAIAYVLRLSVTAIVWAMKTLKDNQSKRA